MPTDRRSELISKIETIAGKGKARAWLRASYAKMPPHRIAGIIGGSRAGVVDLLLLFGIRLRSSSEAIAMQWAGNETRRKMIGEVFARAHTVHGESKRRSPEYNSWSKMRERCSNGHHHAHAAYGGRGIEVCERWWQSFSNFLQDMGRRPSQTHTLDRIDNDLGYSPNNCRWATKAEQARNSMRARRIEIDGRHVPLVEAAEEFGINPATLVSRLKRGWDPMKALHQPVRHQG